MVVQVLNSISKPPGSAPPFIPFKPVPRLVPLPSKHTLPVQQPNRFKLSNFGELREDNLQMVLLARRITQQLVDIRHAPIPLPHLPPHLPSTCTCLLHNTVVYIYTSNSDFGKAVPYMQAAHCQACSNNSSE